MKRRSFTVVIAALALGAAGCATDGKDTDGSGGPESGRVSDTGSEFNEGAGSNSGSGSSTVGISELETVYFDYDTAQLKGEGRSLLEANVDCMNKTDRTVYVIGHTDPRGTDEYNIALSDGRARAVADYMANLGIDPARFRIIPKGEADAVGTSDATYTQDRRVDFEWK